MFAAHQSSNYLQAQLATAEKKIQRYTEIIVSQADEITDLRNNLCEIPALRAQLAAAEKSYNDLVGSQDDELLRNNLCKHCRTRFTSVTVASAPSTSGPLPARTLNPNTDEVRSPSLEAVSFPSPSQDPAAVPSAPGRSIAASLSKSSETDSSRTESLSESGFDDEAEAFSAPAFSGTKTNFIPESTHFPVPDPPEQVDHCWSIDHNPRAKSVLQLSFLRSFSFEDPVHCLKFSPDGKYLAVGLAKEFPWHTNGKGLIFDAETGTQACVLEGMIEKVKSGFFSISFSPNGQLLAVGHHDARITVWTVRKKRIRNLFKGHTSSVTSVEFSPSGRHIISASWDMTVRVWSVRDGSSRIFVDNCSSLYTARLSPDGQYFAAGDWDKSLRIWCLRTGKLVEKWNFHSMALGFMPDGKALVSGSWDERIRSWSVDLPNVRRTGAKPEPAGLTPKNFPGEGKQAILEFDRQLNWINCLAVSPDGRWVLSGSTDSTRIWDAQTGVHQCTLLGHSEEISCVDFSPKGNYLAIGGFDRRVSLWKYATG